MSGVQRVGQLKIELGELRKSILLREKEYEKELSRVHTVHRERARNLLFYWAFRDCQREGLVEGLKSLGLDSLEDVEWDVLGRLDTVLERLDELSGSVSGNVKAREHGRIPGGPEALRHNSDIVFGPPANGRDTRIMVTLSANAEDRESLVHDLFAAGAGCFRINCARDSREAWHRLIDRLHREETGGKRPLIFMDLGGSKLRVTSCAGGNRSVRLEAGDTLFINRGYFPSAGLRAHIADGEGEGPRREIAVSEPAALTGVLPGHRIWFDDGKIGGIVRERREDTLRVEITYAKKGGKKLRLERGLNLPDTQLRLPALTRKDLDDLPFAARQADFLALSFIRTPADVHEFRQALEEVDAVSPAMVIKIETREALQHLPELILAGMCREKVALLLARGDLAVECGIEEIPGIQRDVVRYCAAAALPLFWATGVMERMCRTGEPSRAEVTDAVEASRAQCVMLNKGPHTMEALRLLGSLLNRSNEKR